MIVFDPLSSPATGSCSEAIALTSPTGGSNVPAVERMTWGERSTASPPLWSRCSWLISSGSAVMATRRSPYESRNADCPNHRTSTAG
jgi:hypothetical protein